MNVSRSMSTPLAQEQRLVYEKAFGGPVVHSVLANHWARLIEVLNNAERLAELVEREDFLAPEIRNMDLRTPREGVGIVEAPRGTLIHHYTSDSNGIITSANMIVASLANVAAMSMGIQKAAKAYIHEGRADDGLLNMVEMAFRTYDPCMSCATHNLPGRMPLQVALHQRGRADRFILRSSDGRVAEVRNPRDDGKRHMSALEIFLEGRVQGVGFRPFVWNLAKAHGVAGWVGQHGAGRGHPRRGGRIDAAGVLQGGRHGPPRAGMDPDASRNGRPGPRAGRFSGSGESDPSGEPCGSIVPDLCMCESCRRELFDPSNRRFAHPFITCSRCGPRVQHHREPSLRPTVDQHAEISDVSGMPEGVRGSPGPPVPRPTHQLPPLRSSHVVRSAIRGGAAGTGAAPAATGSTCGRKMSRGAAFRS